MAWHTGPLVAFDLETTGVDTETARIVTATVLVINGAEVTERSWLVNPGIDIPDEAAAIHGITTEKAQADGTPAAKAVDEIADEVEQARTVGWPLIAYNACYDLTVLDRELRRHGREPLEMPLVVDPLVIDRRVDKWRKGKRTLTAACQVYGIQLSEQDAHTSKADALAAARVAYKLAARYPEIGDMELEDLHNGQAAWHAEWADSFEAYLRSQGKADHIARDWPVAPHTHTSETGAA
jgi:DNA polymerase-3 subunit epsilon